MQLHEACRSGDLDTVTALLRNGVNVEYKDEVCIIIPDQHNYIGKFAHNIQCMVVAFLYV